MDDFDDLFDYDVHASAKDTAPDQGDRNADLEKADDLGLGLDSAVKVTKKRTPLLKLDEKLLLSETGIPNLRKIMKRNLKFKGSGHEFTDVARMLNLYQIWLDQMYPRTRFLDGLAMVEKLGHSKRVQMGRREWLGEEKTLWASERRQPQPDGEHQADGLGRAGAGAGLDAQAEEEARRRQFDAIFRSELPSSAATGVGTVPPAELAGRGVAPGRGGAEAAAPAVAPAAAPGTGGSKDPIDLLDDDFDDFDDFELDKLLRPGRKSAGKQAGEQERAAHTEYGYDELDDLLADDFGFAPKPKSAVTAPPTSTTTPIQKGKERMEDEMIDFDV